MPLGPLGRLVAEDPRAIHDSLRGAQDWHAYQAHKAMAADVRAAQEQARAAEKRAETAQNRLSATEEQAHVYQEIAERALAAEEVAKQFVKTASAVHRG